MPLLQKSLTLSRHFSLSFIASGRSSGLHPVSSHSCWMYVRADRPAFARPYVEVHRSTTTLLYKNITLFLLCGVKASVVCERRAETRIDWYIDPWFLLLTIQHWVIFKSPFSTSSASRPEQLSRKPSGYIDSGSAGTATASHGALSVTASWLWLRTSLTPTGNQASARIFS